MTCILQEVNFDLNLSACIVGRQFTAYKECCQPWWYPANHHLEVPAWCSGLCCLSALSCTPGYKRSYQPLWYPAHHHLEASSPCAGICFLSDLSCSPGTALFLSQQENRVSAPVSSHNQSWFLLFQIVKPNLFFFSILFYYRGRIPSKGKEKEKEKVWEEEKCLRGRAQSGSCLVPRYCRGRSRHSRFLLRMWSSVHRAIEPPQARQG